MNRLMKSLLLVTVVAALSATGCSSNVDAPRDGENIGVVRSPDQNFEAVIRKVDIDSTIMVAQWYQVLIRSLVIEPQEFKVMLSADKTEGLHLRWNESGQLEVCYGPAQIGSFRNTFVAYSREPIRLETAEIVLRRTKSLADCRSAPQA